MFFMFIRLWCLHNTLSLRSPWFHEYKFPTLAFYRFSYFRSYIISDLSAKSLHNVEGKLAAYGST